MTNKQLYKLIKEINPENVRTYLNQNNWKLIFTYRDNVGSLWKKDDTIVRLLHETDTYADYNELMLKLIRVVSEIDNIDMQELVHRINMTLPEKTIINIPYLGLTTIERAIYMGHVSSCIPSRGLMRFVDDEYQKVIIVRNNNSCLYQGNWGRYARVAKLESMLAMPRQICDVNVGLTDEICVGKVRYVKVGGIKHHRRNIFSAILEKMQSFNSEKLLRKNDLPYYLQRRVNREKLN